MDSGAVPSLVTEALASALRLPRTPCRREFGCASGSTLQSQSIVTVTLSSPSAPDQALPVVCHVVPKLPSSTPPKNPKSVLAIDFLREKGPFADPQLGGDIDILLGVSDSSRCHCGPRCYTKDKAGYTVPTIFGWVIGGCLPGAPTNQTVFTIQPSNRQLGKDLERLWEFDRVAEERSLTKDELSAVTQFKDNYIRLPSGRFQVTLPRKDAPPIIGTTREIAVRRFLRNEKSLLTKGNLSRFQEVMQEYLDLGHAEIVPQSQIKNTPHYYLPVHGVVKESSTSTKLRAVFDASCKSSTGIALNDIVLPGPNLYAHLSTVLNQFRMFPVVFTGDIRKMFREIQLDPKERDLHRFILRNEHGQLEDCRMLRLTFGVAASPYLATQCLRQLAEDVRPTYPEVSHCIEQHFYVDDCLSGAATVKQAAILIQQLTEALASAGMSLRKFRSNSDELLSTIPEDLRETSELTIKDSDAAKTLGLHWPSTKDTFHVAVPAIDTEAPVTKRSVASWAAQVYDVQGWFAPSTIRARILLQSMWKAGLDWDAEAPEATQQLWRDWMQDLSSIRDHPIPRRLQPYDQSVIAMQLHGFSDASEKAYGAAVYLRTLFKDTTVTTRLVMAKARVAPVKAMTIPRLELVAADLLAKLLMSIRSDLRLPAESCYAWTDSSIVLAWINHNPANLQVFQANRVNRMTEAVDRKQWRHVRSADNPADLASRGIPVSDLSTSRLWWNGPGWLSLSPSDWPRTNLSLPRPDTGLKSTNISTISTVGNKSTQQSAWELWSRYSNHNFLVRVLARIRRVTSRMRRRTTPTSAALTSQEVEEARNLIYKQMQTDSYPEVYRSLQKGEELPRGHPLGKYNLQLEQGLIRLKGRVKEEEVLPLSLKSPLTRLLISTRHGKGHPDIATSLTLLGRDFHIPGLRRHLKLLSRQCVICQKEYARPVAQRMGNLPEHRTTPSPPFSRVGIDFAGPFLITRGNPRKPTRVKAYSVLFVCLTTKAIHIELCADLSSEAFLATLQRFTARRGLPSDIYSDNGTNLVGVRNKLAAIAADTTNQYAHQNYIRWHLIPPRTPHFGGLWEAGVQAMKRLLSKQLSSVPLRYDELETALLDVEAILNSRPLFPYSSTDPDNPEPLTAGHFLIGRPLKALPSGQPDDTTKTSNLRRWNLIQRLTSDLWTKWKTTYLQSLRARQKWHKTGPAFAIGDIVLIKDEQLKTTQHWPVGRIVNTFPGKDGLIRVVDVLYLSKTYRRGTDRLVLLVPRATTPVFPAPGSMSGTIPSPDKTPPVGGQPPGVETTSPPERSQPT